jgi:hypothetical protein
MTSVVGLLLLCPSLSLARPESRTISLGEKLPLERIVRLAEKPAPQAVARQQPDGFVITAQTEVLLDGRPCRYDDVPDGAAIVQLEVAADGKTVLKVHFRTRK